MYDQCFLFCITELFAEVIFSEQLTSGSEVDLYEVVPENDELQRERKVSFGQLEVYKSVPIINIVL